MKQSIETIWKDGFMKDDVLVAPKINNLYAQKSKNIVDKLKHMFKMNLYAIVIGAIIILTALAINGSAWLGAFVFLSLMWTVKLGQTQLKMLEKIDKNVSSYEYIKTFDGWLKGLINDYTRLYRFFYPMMVVAVLINARFSEEVIELFANITKDFPETFLILGIPHYFIYGVIVIAALVSLFAPAIYRLDMNIVYGRAFKKLDEIITDMEELRA
jgi:hypothetical protein